MNKVGAKGLSLSVCAVLVAAILLAAGCGDSADGETATTGPTAKGPALDREIFRLEPGVSVDEVRSQLGKPRWEREHGSEQNLYYGRWILTFAPNLRTRLRYYRRDPGRLEGQELDQKVSELGKGATMPEVRESLGPPEALELYTNPPRNREALWYGNGQWKIVFFQGRMTAKSSF